MWTYFGDFRVVNSISCGPMCIYMAGPNGIARFDKLQSKWEFLKSRNPFPGDIKLIAHDAYTNEIWFVTQEELGRYNPTFEDYRAIEIPEGYTGVCSLGISDECVYLYNGEQFAKLKKFQDTWVLLDSCFSKIQWFPTTFPNQYPWLAPYYILDKFLKRYEMICAAKDRNWLWVGTDGQGVYKYDITTFIPEDYLLGVPGGKILSIYKDTNSIWLGSANGITKWNSDNDLYTYYYSSEEYGLLSSEASSIVSNYENVWFGTPEGVVQFNKQSKTWQTFTRFDGLPSEQVTSLILESNKLWIGTTNGLAKIPVSPSSSRFGGRSGADEKDEIITQVFKGLCVNDIAIDSSGVWLATSRGVFRKSHNTWEEFIDPDKIFPHGVYKILFDANKIYFGSRQGLLVYTGNGWQRFTYPVTLPGKRIFSIAADSLSLWVGTDKGVAVWDKKLNIWERYTEKNSPITSEVYSILLDNGYVYFGTRDGLIRLNKR